MLKSIIHRTILAVLIASAPLVGGCYVEAHETYPDASSDYRPLVNDNGYVVYYDDAGEPYYYEGERVVYVQRTSPVYSRYVGHYRTYRSHYARWYGRYGYRYRYTRYRY